MTITLTKINDCQYITNDPFHLEVNYYEDEGWFISTEYHTEDEIKDYFDNGYKTLEDVLETVKDYIETWENHI